MYIEQCATQGNEISAVLKDLTENSVYKVNVFAIVYDSDEKEVESKELHEKVKLDIQSNNFIVISIVFRLSYQKTTS